MTGDAARSDHDHPPRWCVYCYQGVVQVMGEWRHRPEFGSPVVRCRPGADSQVATPAPEGMRLRPRRS